jgi:hypothetical protein
MRKYVAAVVWSVACAAFGVIKVDFPVSRVFRDSQLVCVGTVTEINAEMKLATVKVDAVQKGSFNQEKVRFQLAQPDGLAARIVVGSPVVLFLAENDGKSIGIIHAADTWLLANGIAGTKPPVWRTAQVYDEVTKSYAGRTIGVVRLVEALKDGRNILDDSVDPEGFGGRGREVAKLGAKPIFMISADINGDGRPDLAVGTENRVRLYSNRAQEYTDVTAGSGIEAVKGGACAAGDLDGDGKVDLLIDKVAWFGTGGTFKRNDAVGSALPEEPWTAGAIHDVTGDGKADIVVMMKNGGLLVLENPGSTDRPWTLSRTNLWNEGGDASAVVFSVQWGDDGELCAMVVRGEGLFRYGVSRKSRHAGDLARLTGSTLESCGGLKERPVRAIAAVAWDSDGNRKADFLTITETGGLMLMNRGLGAFLINNGTHEKVRNFVVDGQAQRFTSGCFLAAGPPKPAKKLRQSLFVACPDGRVFELE